MKFLPLDKFTLVSRFRPAALHLKLKAVTESEELVRSKRTNASYFGQVTGLGFKIRTTTKHRLAFVPLIVGRYEETSTGTKIHVTQRLSYHIIFGTIISLVSLIYILYGPQAHEIDTTLVREALANPMDYGAFNDREVQLGLIKLIGPWLFVPLPLALLFYFWPEARKTRQRLSETFQAIEDVASR